MNNIRKGDTLDFHRICEDFLGALDKLRITDEFMVPTKSLVELWRQINKDDLP